MTVYLGSGISSQNSQILKAKLKEVKKEQGFIGQMWNGIKEITTLGVSYSDCEKMLKKYEKGEISQDEAMQYILDFEKKQDTMTDLISNTATGAVAIAAVGTGPIGWGVALTQGAVVGAVAKTGINFFDRATNKVKNDEFDLKEIDKERVSWGVFRDRRPETYKELTEHSKNLDE